MVLHSIACKICAQKCDEHSGRVCRDCAIRIKRIKAGEMSVREFTPLRTEEEKHTRELQNL